MKFNKEKCKIYDIGIALISIFIILLFLNYNKKLREEKEWISGKTRNSVKGF